MGLSSSKTTSGPSKFAQPFISAGANAITDAYNTNKGPTAEIASSIQGLVPGLLEKYNAGNPSVNAAQGYNSDVLGGKYLTGNPYLESIVNKSRENAMGAVGGAFGRLGAFGGTKYAEAAGRGVADAENTLRYNDYGAERGRMDTAAGQAPSIAAADYLGISPLLAAAQGGTDLAYAPSDHYSSALAQLLGNSQTTKSSSNIFDGLLKAGATVGAGFAASDRRLKTNIRKIGEFADGLGQYIWTYIWGGPEQLGVMADEVERLRPWALGPVIGGFATVNYSAL
jgi:hypothetical protein